MPLSNSAFAFMNPARRDTNWRPADFAFLAMALLVHSALLLVPFKSWQSAAPAAVNRLTVDLKILPQPPRQPEISPAQPEKTRPEKAQPEPVPVPKRTARIALEELPAQDQKIAPPTTVDEAEPLTARQIRELAEAAEWETASRSSTPRQLGSAQPYQPPANWNKNAGAPYLAEFENTFNGMTVPEDVEIVDRWVADDGSHNVVLNLPNGDTVCGRAEPYNPMQPLVEHIMMFRACAGGGKRTFTMPDRYNKGR